jgi:hypothetical protein
MSTKPSPGYLPALIAIARVLSLNLGLLLLIWGAVWIGGGRVWEGALLACAGVFAAVCLYAVLTGLTALVDLAQVARYRAERDQEIDLLLTEVRVLLKEQRPPSGASTAASGSGLFKSSVMPFNPEGDAALTATRPAIKE